MSLKFSCCQGKHKKSLRHDSMLKQGPQIGPQMFGSPQSSDRQVLDRGWAVASPLCFHEFYSNDFHQGRMSHHQLNPVQSSRSKSTNNIGILEVYFPSEPHLFHWNHICSHACSDSLLICGNGSSALFDIYTYI